MASTQQRAFEILREELPELSPADLDVPFDRLAIDSFALVSLRARLETLAGREIDDELWTSAETPADLIRTVSGNGAAPAVQAVSNTGERRGYILNMPQMALSGLSESWLFKELGDMHWSMITRGLGCPSSELKDGAGDRLYATFTRISVALDRPLAGYRENAPFALKGSISRFGAGVFFSDVEIGTGGRARIMSSFSRRGEADSNMSLLKGQPDIPPDCAIAALAEQPEFGEEYRARRSARPSSPLFETEYEIIPQHDINGVGLLYFAAYPIIADICEMRHGGTEIAYRHSTRKRDVFYFSNCDPHETVIHRLHVWQADETGLRIESSLSRKADGALMAYLATTKEPTGG